MNEFVKSKIEYSRNGDMLEVRLLDNSYNKYFEDKARINNKKEMKELMKRLEQKGVSFPTNWLD